MYEVTIYENEQGKKTRLKYGEGEVTQGQDPGHDHQDKAKIASMYFNFKITCF
jgi:hypothetical protein